MAEVHILTKTPTGSPATRSCTHPNPSNDQGATAAARVGTQLIATAAAQASTHGPLSSRSPHHIHEGPISRGLGHVSSVKRRASGRYTFRPAAPQRQSTSGQLRSAWPNPCSNWLSLPPKGWGSQTTPLLLGRLEIRTPLFRFSFPPSPTPNHTNDPRNLFFLC